MIDDGARYTLTALREIAGRFLEQGEAILSEALTVVSDDFTSIVTNQQAHRAGKSLTSYATAMATWVDTFGQKLRA